jgi:hypothetical protein
MTDSDDSKSAPKQLSKQLSKRPSTGIGPLEQKTKYFIQVAPEIDETVPTEASFDENHPNSIQKMCRRKFTHDLQTKYLNYLAKYGTQTNAALFAGINPRTVQECARTDSDFAEAQKLAWGNVAVQYGKPYC